MKRSLRMLYAFTWLHLLRTSRFAFTLINWGIVDFLWMSIYVLAALVFADPSDYPVVVPTVFWALIAFSLMSTPVWTIGNWVRFYVNLGVFEEHELTGASHTAFLALRALPAIPMALISAMAASLFLYSVTGINPLRAAHPLLVAFSLLAILFQSTLYSLMIAYISLATRAPAPLLDFMNFFLFVAGGIAAPVARLPEPLRVIAVVTPYSHPAELMRYAVIGLRPYLGLVGEALATMGFIGVLAIMVAVISRISIDNVRRWGVRGIGRT